MKEVEFDWGRRASDPVDPVPRRRLPRAFRPQSEGSAGALCSSSNSRSANAMSSSRCRLLRRARKLFMSLRPKAVVSSAFNAASLGGIGMRLAANLPGLQP